MRRDEEEYKDTGDTEGYKGIHTKGYKEIQKEGYIQKEYIQRDTYKGIHTKGYIQRDTKMRHRSWYLANESPYTVLAEEGE